MEVSAGQYAELRGVTAAAVSKAFKSGRLKQSVRADQHGHIAGIDPVLANKEWDENTDPRKIRHRPRDYESDSKPPAGITLDLPQPHSDNAALNKNRALEQEYKAKMAQLEYEERTGQLVDAKQVRDEAYKLARGVRDALMNIPDRLAAEIAGISDHHQIHKRISEELRNALQMVIEIAQTDEAEQSNAQ